MALASKRNRIMNRSRVLRVIWRQPLLSRIDVANVLGLDKSTVSVVVNELVELGVIEEVAIGDASPQGGRRPVQLQIKQDFGSVLGLELQPGFYRAALCDLHGQIQRQWSGPGRNTEEDFATYLLNLIHGIMTDLGSNQTSVIGIGVAMGGLINSVQNIITGSIPMGLENFQFQQEVANKLSIPIVAENDANACAWGELTFHRTSDIHNFLYVYLQIHPSSSRPVVYGGIGVGLGLVINGTIFPGATFTAGEFRSAFWEEGRSGQFSLSDQDALLVTKDAKIRKKLFRELAKNLAVIINVVNLSHVFIGGDVLGYDQELTPIIKDELQKNWPYDTPPVCEIHYSTFGDQAVAYGAAGMMLDRLFSDQIFPLGDIRNRHGRDEILSEFNETIVRLGER